MVKVTAEQILLARERRVEHQQELTLKYKLPLLVVRVNYPGLDRDNSITRSILDKIKGEVSIAFSEQIIYNELRFTAEGPIFIAMIKDRGTNIKEKAIAVEEQHPLGRLVDIDVYDSTGNGIGREELGYAMRKCYLCNDVAQCCVRARKHSQEDVIYYIITKYKEFLGSFYGKGI